MKSYVFENAYEFSRLLDRSWREDVELMNGVCRAFPEEDCHIIKSDFFEFLEVLMELRLIRVEKEESSVWKSNLNGTNLSRQSALNNDVGSSQELLSKYFLEHPTLVNLQIDITQACTERCVHCYVPEYGTVCLTFEKIKEALDWFAFQGGLSLSISGGECLLHPDFAKIIHYANSKDLAVKVFSNLTVCTEEIAKLFQEANVRVQTSLYSMNEELHDAITQLRGSYKTTRCWLEKLVRYGVQCSIACPLMRENYRGYSDVRKYAKSLGCNLTTDFAIIGRADGSTDNLVHRLTIEEVKAVLEELARESVAESPEYFNAYFQSECFARQHEADWLLEPLCDVCISTMCLGANGEYHPCTAFGDVVLGDCQRDSIEWVWQHSPNTLRIRSLRGKDIRRCVKCKIRPYCSICLCRNQNENGDMCEPSEYFCRVAAVNKEIVEMYRQEYCGRSGART